MMPADATAASRHKIDTGLCEEAACGGYHSPMRMPAGLKKLDDRVLGSRGSATEGTRTRGRRSDRHEDVYPQDKERSVEKTSDTAETNDSTGTTETTAKKPKTERVERTTRSKGDDGADKSSAKRGNGDGLQNVLATVWRISRLIFLALGLLMVIAIALILLPANEDNVIVSNVLSWAETVAGPFKDVFTVDDPERMRIYNYGLAAAVYFLLATIVSKLPTGPKKKAG